MADDKAMSACRIEIEKHCSNQDDQKRSLSCLLKHEKEVSQNCKQELQRISKTLEAAGSRGGGGLSSFGGIMGGMGLMPPQKTIITLNGNFSPEGNPTTVEQSKMSIATPIYSKNGKAFAMSVGGGRIAFNETQLFDDGQKTPQELHRVDLGAQYSSTLKNKAFFGLRGSIGSASDKPFYSKDEITFSLSTFYTKPGKGRGQWIYSVFLSNNNSLANYIPIPGFIYLYRNQGFTGMFGLPFFSMQWTPRAPWILSMSFFITNFNSEIAYGLRDKFQTYAGFAISQQNFLRVDREEKTDRLFFNEKKVFLGARSPLTNAISTELQTGLSFDRKLKEGESFNDTHLESDLGRSWYISMNWNFAI